MNFSCSPEAQEQQPHCRVSTSKRKIKSAAEEKPNTVKLRCPDASFELQFVTSIKNGGFFYIFVLTATMS